MKQNARMWNVEDGKQWALTTSYTVLSLLHYVNNFQKHFLTRKWTKCKTVKFPSKFPRDQKSSNCFFCQTSCPKPNYSSFTTKKWQILTVKKLEPDQQKTYL